MRNSPISCEFVITKIPPKPSVLVQLDVALKQLVWVFDFYKITLLSGQYLHDRPVKSCEIIPKLPLSSFQFLIT